jgi:hypothetical protein
MSPLTDATTTLGTETSTTCDTEVGVPGNAAAQKNGAHKKS